MWVLCYKAILNHNRHFNAGHEIGMSQTRCEALRHGGEIKIPISDFIIWQDPFALVFTITSN